MFIGGEDFSDTLHLKSKTERSTHGMSQVGFGDEGRNGLRSESPEETDQNGHDILQEGSE